MIVMQTFAHAQDMIRRGLVVFPLSPNSKQPLRGKSWKDMTAADYLTLFEVTEDLADYNYAIDCTASGIVVIGPDTDAGDLALHASGELPRTLTIRSRSGGRHYYFKPRPGERFANSVNKLFQGVDVRGDGGYVVGPGSVVDGKAYTIETDAPIADLPDWLAERLGRKSEAPITGATTLPGVDEFRAVTLAMQRLDGMAVVQEGGRNSAAFAMAQHIMDCGVQPALAAAMLAKYFRASPPLSEFELEGIVERAANVRTAPIGAAAPEVGFEVEPETPAAAAPSKQRLEFQADIDLAELGVHRANALVKDLLHRGSTAVLYGDSGAGKSFCALDLGWHVAQGKDWRGNKVKQAPVLYVSLEGIQGFRLRMVAVARAHGDAPWFARHTIPISLIQGQSGEDGVREIVTAAAELSAKCGAPVGLIVVDTLSQAIAGMDENSTDVMSGFIRHRLGGIATLTGAAVMAVHHTSKAGDMRGSSTLRGAADLLLKATRDKDDEGKVKSQARYLTAEKVKDGEERQLFEYYLNATVLGHDADGDPMTSCTIEMIDNTPREIDAHVLACIEQNWNDGEGWSSGAFSVADQSKSPAHARVAAVMRLSADEVYHAMRRLEHNGHLEERKFKGKRTRLEPVNQF